MKLPNGYGSVVKLSGKRRKPYQVRKTVGWHYDEVKDKQVQDMITIGYAATRAEGLQMLADYNNNPFDTKAAKMTFSDVYEEWSKRKFPTISESNVKGYTASYKSCEPLYNKIFKDIKLVDLQTVIDTCGKNFPTLKKIKVLFNQLFDYALKMIFATKIIQASLILSNTRIVTLTNTIETSLRKMKLILSGNKRKINIIR